MPTYIPAQIHKLGYSHTHWTIVLVHLDTHAHVNPRTTGTLMHCMRHFGAHVLCHMSEAPQSLIYISHLRYLEILLSTKMSISRAFRCRWCPSGVPDSTLWDRADPCFCSSTSPGKWARWTATPSHPFPLSQSSLAKGPICFCSGLCWTAGQQGASEPACLPYSLLILLLPCRWL